MDRILLLKKIRTAIRMLKSDRTIIYQKIGLGRDSGSQAVYYLLDNTVNRYWKKYDLDKYFSEKDRESSDFRLFISNHKKMDVVNLHKTIISNQCKKVVEFGCGVSTIIMAHAMSINNKKYNIRGKVHAVEAHPKWADIVRNKLIEIGYEDYAEIIQSTPRLTKLGGQICHIFDKLPDVRPDVIYLDGPAPRDVEGNINGITMKGLSFVVAADPLLYEYSFYPGFQMIVDGRYNNVEFLKNNFKRKYSIKRDFVRDITTFYLVK